MKKLLPLLFIPLSLTAQKDYSRLLDDYMQAQVNVKQFSGTVLVMSHNKPLLEKGYGLADYEWNISNIPQSKFRIGSITKQFTAAAILQLEEQGKLSTDDKLSKYIPGYPKGDSVTLHMLLNHTSGIANYTDLPEFEGVARQSWTKDSMISFFKNKPYNFSPGSKWAYSNSGFFLLGYIIEKVSGQSYNDYLRQHILDKINMTNTGIDNLDTILPMRVRGYKQQDKRIMNADFIAMEWPFSAGVIYSTVEDLYKWDRALYNNSVISEGSRKKMFTPGMNNYGFGILIDSFENHLRIWHNGGIPGFVSNISRYVNDDVCIVVLSNNESNADLVSNALAKIVFGLPVELPYEHKEIPVDAATLDRYVGKYKAFLTLEVIKKDGRLYRHRDGTPDIELKAESPTKFFYADGSDRQLEFEVDKAGKVVKIWFINNGERGEMQKLN
ncbi:MAG TPA: serine hydrolase [Panacibacter sp.]|nr:serine hydrolase [Panacibacter sp.]HNP43618.1 serine hydrolase [Panacibacter sp.]